MAYPGIVIQGHVAGIGRGISVSDAAPSIQGLPSVDPVFTWVRLAQRIPVRVFLDDVPCPIVLSAGMTATVTVLGISEKPTSLVPPLGSRTGADVSRECKET